MFLPCRPTRPQSRTLFKSRCLTTTYVVELVEPLAARASVWETFHEESGSQTTLLCSETRSRTHSSCPAVFWYGMIPVRPTNNISSRSVIWVIVYLYCARRRMHWSRCQARGSRPCHMRWGRVGDGRRIRRALPSTRGRMRWPGISWPVRPRGREAIN